MLRAEEKRLQFSDQRLWLVDGMANQKQVVIFDCYSTRLIT